MDESIKEKSGIKEPKVEIFGEDVDSRKERYSSKYGCCDERFRYHFHHYNHHHGSLPWGLAFILIGLLFLLSNFGALPPTVWQQVSHLWPLLIVFMGLDILFGNSWLSDIINTLIGLFILATILGIIFLHTSPQVLGSLPQNIQGYLHSVNNYFQIK